MTGPLVIVGDTLLDLDTTGSATRLSPDAPVPVLDDLVEHARPGGAGLAAAMAAGEGAEVVLVTAVGADPAGMRLEELLRGIPGLTLSLLPTAGQTPVKHRIRAGDQSLLRLDTGGAGGPVGGLTPSAAEAIAAAAAVLVADYGRGVATAPGVGVALVAAAARTPLTWDPHPRGEPPVPGARLVTPNRAEAAGFARALPRSAGELGAAEGDSLVAVRRHADSLVHEWHAHAVAVTLGAGGALLSYGSGAPAVLPAPVVTAVDTCGAGDRLAVTAALSLMLGAVTVEAVQDGVAAAAAYVGAGGPASLRALPAAAGTGAEAASFEEVVERVRRRGGTLVATGGCFDILHAGHVATLEAARRLGDALVVCLNSDESVRRLKGPTRPLVAAADRRRVLEAMADVDAVVVFSEDTPDRILRRLRPDVWAKGGDYAGSDLAEASVLEEWGGQAVVLPYLPGRSTSRLVDAVRTSPSTSSPSTTSPSTTSSSTTSSTTSGGIA